MKFFTFGHYVAMASIFASLLVANPLKASSMINVGDYAESHQGYVQLADVAGEWTKCIARSNGQQYNIVNGQASKQRCHQLAIRCTGNPNVTSTYYSPPVVINAPYQRCTSR